MTIQRMDNVLIVVGRLLWRSSKLVTSGPRSYLTRLSYQPHQGIGPRRLSQTTGSTPAATATRLSTLS